MMHGVSFSLPYAVFGRCCLSAFITPLSIYTGFGSGLGMGMRAAPRCWACIGRLYSSLLFSGLILRNATATGLSRMQRVPSYKRGGEDILALFFWCLLHFKLGFWVAIPFDTTVFTRPVSGLTSFYLFGEGGHSERREVLMIAFCTRCSVMHFFVVLFC